MSTAPTGSGRPKGGRGDLGLGIYRETRGAVPSAECTRCTNCNRVHYGWCFAPGATGIVAPGATGVVAPRAADVGPRSAADIDAPNAGEFVAPGARGLSCGAVASPARRASEAGDSRRDVGGGGPSCARLAMAVNSRRDLGGGGGLARGLRWRGDSRREVGGGGPSCATLAMAGDSRRDVGGGRASCARLALCGPPRGAAWGGFAEGWRLGLRWGAIRMVSAVGSRRDVTATVETAGGHGALGAEGFLASSNWMYCSRSCSLGPTIRRPLTKMVGVLATSRPWLSACSA